MSFHPVNLVVLILILASGNVFTFKLRLNRVQTGEVWKNGGERTMSTPSISHSRAHLTYSRDESFSLSMNAVPITVKDRHASKVLGFSRLALRCTTVSWWIQIVLTVISSVILIFANTVRQSSSLQSFWSSGFAFSSMGVAISFISSFLTWKNSRMCKRLPSASDTTESMVALQKAFEMSIAISLLGMFVTLLGAEQIVGTLASKVLSLQGIQPLIGTVGTQNSLQALDIFLVQANTNTLLALFSPVVCYWGLQVLKRGEKGTIQP